MFVIAEVSLIILTLSSAIIPSVALDVIGNVQWNDVCSGIQDLRSSKVVLDDGRMYGGITRNGSFVIPDVSPGTFLLSIISPDHSFDQLRIDVLESTPVPEVRPYLPGTPLNPPSPVLLQYPIKLVPRQKHVYFIPPESFNLVAMFSNPMMLMMVLGGAMMLAMPYLMNNLDPEALDELKGQQAKMAEFQNAVTSGDLKSGFSTLLNNSGEPSDTPRLLPSAPRTSSTSKNRASKNKKR